MQSGDFVFKVQGKSITTIAHPGNLLVWINAHASPSRVPRQHISQIQPDPGTRLDYRQITFAADMLRNLQS